MEEDGIAIPLIIHQEREGFKVTPEGLAFLNSIEKKIGVISVAGKYRTGKSYLLNKIILNLKSRGFGVGPSINPCTKGIWIYNQAIDFKTADGEEISLLILDSEGLGAFDEDANHDTKIFMLAVLLSSFFIYNSVGSIDENALNNISLVLNLTKNLQVRSTDSESDVEELANYFPSFLWVLRDFSLQLIDSTGNAITSKEYLENALMPQKGVSDAIEAKNRVRKLLKHFFKDRDCFALIRPSEDEKTLQNLQNVSESALRPEFVRQTANLRKSIYRKVKVKALNGKPLTGKMLAGITIAYIEAINKGAVPTIEGAWQSVVTSECAKQIDLASAEYEKKLKSLITQEPLSQQDLKSLHKSLKLEAHATFKDKAVGDDLEPYYETLKKKLLERFTIIRVQNERKIIQKCDEECHTITIDFEDKLKTGEYTDFQVFKRDFEKKIGEMRKNLPPSDATELKLKELSANLLTEAAEYISRSAIMERENLNRRLAQQVEFLKTNFDSKREEFSKEKDYYKTRLQEVESENYKLKAGAAGLEMRLEELKLDKEHLATAHQQRLDTLKDDFKDRFSEYKEKYEETLKLYQDLQQKYNQDISKLQKDLALARQEIEWRNRECGELKARKEEIENEYREVRSNLRKAREELEDREEAVKVLKNSPKSPGFEPNNDWLAERNLLTSQIDRLKAQIDENKSLKEALVVALQTRNTEQRVEPKDTSKHLLAILEKTEERCQDLEQKVERLKKFQIIVQNSTSIQCKMCGKTITSNLFAAHITICEDDFAKNGETGEYIIVVTQIVLKEDLGEQNSNAEYTISVTYKGRTWVLTKRYNNFKILESSLKKELPDVEIPDSALLNPQNIGSIFNNKQQVRIEERKKRFQDYLMSMARVGRIKDSNSLRKFLNADQYFPEEMSERGSSKRDSTRYTSKREDYSSD